MLNSRSPDKLSSRLLHASDISIGQMSANKQSCSPVKAGDTGEVQIIDGDLHFDAPRGSTMTNTHE